MAKLYVPLGFVLAAMISADVDNCPQAASAVSMLQSKAAKSSLVAAAVHGHVHAAAAATGCPNLVMFMDGTWNWLDAQCDWVPGDCETNIAKMYRLSAEIDDSIQKTHYETGVGTTGEGATTTGDDPQLGIGTKAHAENVYKWLTENYNGCNKLFMFGFSRGTLEARMVQGMIHRVGIAKAGFHAEAVNASFDGGDADAATFKASEQAWDTTAEIEFVGLFDATLRTLLHPWHHKDIASYHMRMTSSVKKFAHAMAISEWRETHEAGALHTSTATLAEQVWFAGIHRDVGGGLPATGASRIAAGWILDKAVDAGLKLPDNWQEHETMAVDYLDDVSTEKGLDALAINLFGVNADRLLSIHTVRNPAKCRTAAGFSGKIKYHQSVQDRRTANKGWVPLPECCPTINSEVEEFGIEYVTNSHYNARKPAIKSSPHWLKISIGKLKNAPPMEPVTSPDYYLKVFNWNSKVSEQWHPLPASEGAGQGCCASIQKTTTKSPTSTNIGSWWWPEYKYELDFTGTTVIIPYEASAADMFVLEVHEDDPVYDDYVGRIKVGYSTMSSTQRTFNLRGGATIEITVETINNDEDAAPLLGGGLAACQWLDLQTGLSRNDMCTSGSNTPVTGGGNAKTCDGYIEDITTGALIDMHGHH